MPLYLERRSEQCGGIDVSVAVDLTVTKKARIFQAGNETQHFCLLTKFQVILEADEVIRVGAQVLLPQLDCCVGDAAGPRIFQSNRLHWSEAQSIASAPCNLFDGKAALEVV